ncbi:MAG: hypothetical protein ACM3N6_15585 [Betaproteobacteria bacterium]
MSETNDPAQAATPWWRVPTVWMVLAGPIAVVVASCVTAVIAWRHIDPVITETPAGTLRAADEVAAPADPKDPLAPALRARNHAALPRR